MEIIPVKHHVYALFHPATWEVRYVGVTRKSIEQRLAEHVWKARRDLNSSVSTPLGRWINKLAEFDLSPQIVLLEATTERDECERRWIAYFKQCDARLLNLTDGGEGIAGLVFSEEHRRKIGDARRGVKRSPEISQMLSRVHKGKTLSLETRRRMSEARKGKTQSEETKVKRVATLTGRTYSAERCANISAGKKRAQTLRQQNNAAVLVSTAPAI